MKCLSGCKNVLLALILWQTALFLLEISNILSIFFYKFSERNSWCQFLFSMPSHVTCRMQLHTDCCLMMQKRVTEKKFSEVNFTVFISFGHVCAYAPQNITTVSKCTCYRKVCSLAGLLPQHVVLQPSWPLITEWTKNMYNAVKDSEGVHSYIMTWRQCS